ncbi:M15 family metallopeptidase [Entomomonas asaccharolytica]|uniref:M15 family metallopeptidase n=1 Tax=Entomomonas asaccharolytica TaxID=2785331 RepID=A0A974RY50_9GAMM|nr:M15 family metallopeptidase [Entomomonas asaccharolytica]QQP86928.1 M15 family metallopeptidase [Entomomonas asaccharolytica]
MTFKFSQRSLDKLTGINPDLRKVVDRALQLSTIDFGITEGLRDRATQEKYVARGASQTMNSRHLTGHAVDVVAYVNGKVTWDWKYYEEISKAFKQASEELSIPIVWGGSWKSLKDGPHFELILR